MTDFWLWWSAELAGLVPAWMKQPGSVTSGKVTIEFRDNVIYMLKQVKGQADSSIEFSSNDESTLVQNSLYEHGDTVTLLLSKDPISRKGSLCRRRQLRTFVVYWNLKWTGTHPLNPVRSILIFI